MYNRTGRNDAEEAAIHQGKGVINQVKGNLKEAWGALTGSSSAKHEGMRDRAKGKIQEAYGDLKEREARLEKDLDDIESGRL